MPRLHGQVTAKHRMPLFRSTTRVDFQLTQHLGQPSQYLAPIRFKRRRVHVALAPLGQH